MEREKLRIGLDSSAKSSVCNTWINIMIDIFEIDSDDEWWQRWQKSAKYARPDFILGGGGVG